MRKALFALALVGCFPRRNQDAPDASTTATATPVAIVDAAPADAGPAFQASFAFMSLKNGSLSECVDVSVVSDTVPDGGAAALDKEVSKKMPKDVTKIPKRCAEQFADRKPLATCVQSSGKTSDAGAQTTLGITDAFYDFGAVGLSDEHMTECIKSGGDWKAIPRDSREWTKAKLEHDSARLRKTARDLGATDEP